MHPEQGLWLRTPFPSWLGESPFPSTVMDLGSLYSGFHRRQQVKGPRQGKQLSFPCKLDLPFLEQTCVFNEYHRPGLWRDFRKAEGCILSISLLISALAQPELQQ